MRQSPPLSDDISSDLGLREPQRLALIRLAATLDGVDLHSTPLEEIEAVAPGVQFDTRFPSFCFALATGVGKTLLMAAHMAYLA
jgi:type III restriction enzyme